MRALLPPDDLRTLVHLLAALAAGSTIGLERSWHGRPAGFRTHALVCLASSVLMLLTVYQPRWFPGVGDSVRLDPTRMAQGIMTGIGFLGGGAIFKEGLTVRGLTTAASIWITSAIGVLMGSGLWFAGAAATILTLGVLSVFRTLESKLPVHQYAAHRVRFERGSVMSDAEVAEVLRRNGCFATGRSWRLVDDGRFLEHRMTVRTSDAANFARLAAELERLPLVREFTLSPAGE